MKISNTVPGLAHQSRISLHAHLPEVFAICCLQRTIASGQNPLQPVPGYSALAIFILILSIPHARHSEVCLPRRYPRQRAWGRHSRMETQPQFTGPHVRLKCHRANYSRLPFRNVWRSRLDRPNIFFVFFIAMPGQCLRFAGLPCFSCWSGI